MAISDILGVKLNDIPQPQQSTIVAAITEIVLSRLTEELYLELNSEDQQTLEKIAEEKDSQNKIFKFLKDRFPDFDERAKKIAVEEKQQLEKKTKTMVEIIKNKNHE